MYTLRVIGEDLYWSDTKGGCVNAPGKATKYSSYDEVQMKLEDLENGLDTCGYWWDICDAHGGY